MMQRFTYLLFVLCLTFSVQGQGSLWQAKQVQNLPLPATVTNPDDVSFTHFQAFQLDHQKMKQKLFAIPQEGRASRRSPNYIYVPMPDGSQELFEIYPSSNLSAPLAKKFPGIRSFTGTAVNQVRWNIRLGYTYQGFYAMIRTPEGEIEVEQFDRTNPELYRVFWLKDMLVSDMPVCGVTDQVFDPTKEHHHGAEANHPVSAASPRSGAPVELFRYEVALSCTGEFGQLHGGTVEDVISVFDRAMAQLNLVYQVETAIKFELIPNNNTLIFIDPYTDPYNNPRDGGGLLDQIQNHLDGAIRPGNYDIGHIFTIGCTDVGGIAGGATCTSGKGRGVTCHSSQNVEAITRRIMTHEFGHQFSAGHSWSNCPGNMGQLASSSAYEPGSGSTIMSYSGACGSANNIGADDLYFHVVSLDEMITFSRERNGFACATVDITDNHQPDLDLAYTDGFYIPISTPFKLTAEAADMDGDPITYCWEQYNLGPTSELGSPRGDAPTFRTFPPTPDPTRYFPNLTNIRTNFSDRREVLPTYSRNLNFRCTVRDNVPDMGGVVWKEVAFKATESAGPFAVQFPNAGVPAWKGGEFKEIKWDVANTDNSLVNCQSVNIKLSTDDGQSFPITLAEGVPNNGSFFVTVPEVTTSAARILVEAADNIFFDMSNQSFRIEPAERPTYGFQIDRYVDQICLPEITSFDFFTEAIASYDSEIRFEVNGLPVDAIAEFTANPILPTEGSSLNIDFTNVQEEGLFEVEITTFSESDTLVRTLFLDLYFSDFSAVAPITPEDGTTGLVEAPTLTWFSSPFARTYSVELATSPAFGPNDIVSSISGISDTFYKPSELLEKNTPHYWRIIPANECGDGDFTRVFGFNTESVNCGSQPSSDVPKNIPSAGLPSINSTLEVTSSFTIEDLDVVNIDITHDRVRDIDVTLISPEGTSVKLFDSRCGNTPTIRISLDDEAPTDIPCPPIGGNTHIPVESLSAFDGENAQGVWCLNVKVTDGFGAGGWIDGWGLQFCSSISLNPPRLVVNDTLPVIGISEQISRDFLLAEDANNRPEELIFTMVTNPVQGDLFLDGNRLSPGDNFSQNDIDTDQLSYRFTGGAEQFDQFQFSVSDGEGGWFGTPNFVFALDEATSTKELGDSDALKLFPNPAHTEVFVQLDQQQNELAELSLFNVQGQLVRSYQFNTAAKGRTIPLDEFISGLYIVRVSTEKAIYTQKLMIQR